MAVVQAATVAFAQRVCHGVWEGQLASKAEHQAEKKVSKE
jgi:hypothetical protein